MGQGLADVMVHIDEDLSDQRRLALEDFLREDPGVVAVGTPKAGSHLMLVLYNPVRLKAHSLISRVAHHGVHAQLVGF